MHRYAFQATACYTSAAQLPVITYRHMSFVNAEYHPSHHVPHHTNTHIHVMQPDFAVFALQGSNLQLPNAEPPQYNSRRSGHQKQSKPGLCCKASKCQWMKHTVGTLCTKCTPRSPKMPSQNAMQKQQVNCAGVYETQTKHNLQRICAQKNMYRPFLVDTKQIIKPTQHTLTAKYMTLHFLYV
jgi:hypothetical protein